LVVPRERYNTFGRKAASYIFDGQGGQQPVDRAMQVPAARREDALSLAP
jgi:hypothetical protein